MRHSVLAVFAVAASLASAAQAAPITMSPDPVTLQGVRGHFTLSLQGGDTSDNRLVFGLRGSNPAGSLPAYGVAAIVFNGVSVVSAGELTDPDSLISGMSIGSSAVGGLLVDFGDPSTASFFVRLSGAPTSAYIYSVSGTSALSLSSSTSRQGCYLDKKVVRFDAAIPEPGAGLCFAAGLALVATRLRRP
jgi:hypothetical protein